MKRKVKFSCLLVECRCVCVCSVKSVNLSIHANSVIVLIIWSAQLIFVVQIDALPVRQHHLILLIVDVGTVVLERAAALALLVQFRLLQVALVRVAWIARLVVVFALHAVRVDVAVSAARDAIVADDLLFV